jgi:hypothetical protein
LEDKRGIPALSLLASFQTKKIVMKKSILSIFLLVLVFTFNSFSQDIIYKADGSKEEAKITLVGEREIQYKKFNNPEGPVYSLSKSEILMITYENGEYEMVSNQNNTVKSNNQELSTNYTRNLVGYHLFDVIYGDFTFSYERILASGTVSIKIPVGFGYAYNSDYNNNSNEWVKNLIYTGIGVNFYPTGQGKWRYFLGPNIRIGYGKQSYWMSSWYYDEYGNYIDNSEEEESEGIYSKFFVDNGVMFTPIKNFSISTIVGVGIRYFPQADENHNVMMPTGYYAIDINYRF